MSFGGFRILKGVREAGAIHRLLFDAVDRLRLRNASSLEDCWANVDTVRELRAQVTLSLDSLRPGNDHRVARPAQVARHLLAPLKWRITGMRPCRRAVRRCVVATQGVDAAILLDQLQLLLGVEYDAVEEGHLVERASDGPLHAGTVVAPDVEDERVIEVSHLLDRVEEPTSVPVGILLEACINLHLPRIELLLGIVERIPGREEIRSLGEDRVLWDDSELLLALERLLAVGVPALVEFTLVLVGPLLRYMMRRVGAASGVVQEPGLLRVLRAHGVQPLDGLVGDIIGEVVLFAVLTLGYTERRVVLRDDRVVLTRRPTQEAPPVVKAPCLRPVVERACRSLDVVRCEVPLAEPARHVAILLQDARKSGATPGPRGCIAWERAGELCDRAETHPVVIAAGQQRCTGRRAEGGHVEAIVREALLLDACHVRGPDRPAERIRLANPASSIRTISTLGAPSGAFGPGTIVQSATDWSNVRPIVPPKVRSGIGSTVRSGLNLWAASARASWSSFMPLLSIWATDLAGESASACSATSRSSSSTMAMIAAVPGLSLSPRPFSMPLLTLCWANLPATAPAAAPTAIEASNGGEKRPTTRPTPPPQPIPLRPMWSPV